jgi:hypothetical protein
MICNYKSGLQEEHLTSVKVTGLAQKLGQLEAANRDLQSKPWASLNLLGQPCNFYAIGPWPASAVRPPPRPTEPVNFTFRPPARAQGLDLGAEAALGLPVPLAAKK